MVSDLTMPSTPDRSVWLSPLRSTDMDMRRMLPTPPASATEVLLRVPDTCRHLQSGLCSCRLCLCPPLQSLQAAAQLEKDSKQ